MKEWRLSGANELSHAIKIFFDHFLRIIHIRSMNKEAVNWSNNLNSLCQLIFKSIIWKILIPKYTKIKVAFKIAFLFALFIYQSLEYRVQILFFLPRPIIALNKQHDIQCFYLIKIMSESKMQTTTADAAVNHPNA